MTLLVLIRHGPTAWNEQGIVQGSTDVPLSDRGRDTVRQWRLPAGYAHLDWVASPLARARETAAILAGCTVPTDPRLAEMDWAVWEGRTLPDLRAELGDLITAWEAKGLDFRAPGGESPRDVQARLGPFLADRATAGRDTVAVTHKGVMRALYALATGWDMTDRPPAKMTDNHAQTFRLDAAGEPRVERLNVALRSDTPPLRAGQGG